MNADDFDFEGTGTSSSNQETNHENNQQQQQEDTTALNHQDDTDINNQEQTDGDGNKNDDDDNSSTGELSEGDSIEFEGATYTVDATGNLVDDKGNIFKEAKDVADWLKSMDVSDSDTDASLDLNAIQEAIGITVTDSEGKNVEFTNDAAGVKAYVNSVIDLKSTELQQAAVNKLYADNPLLKQFSDYVQLTGSPRGFGDIPDRSGIQLDKDNVVQLEAVIKMAAAEFGNKSLNDNYIKYLKDGGGLYDEAKAQLAALQEKDANFRREIETRAEAQRQQEIADNKAYWDSVEKAITGRIISGFKLPESFTKEVNGQKVAITPNDFFNYLSRSTEQDENGNRITGYQKDLSKLTDEEYLNRELLNAWLMFTGGTYKDLIDMAVKEDKVRQLKIKSKEQRTAKSVKIVKKATGKTSINDIVLS